MNRNISNRVKGWSNTTLFAWRMTTLMKRDITLSLSFSWKSWKSTHWENFFFDCANYTMPCIVVLALTYRRKYERIIVNYYFWFFFLRCDRSFTTKAVRLSHFYSAPWVAIFIFASHLRCEKTNFYRRCHKKEPTVEINSQIHRYNHKHFLEKPLYVKLIVDYYGP